MMRRRRAFGHRSRRRVRFRAGLSFALLAFAAAMPVAAQAHARCRGSRLPAVRPASPCGNGERPESGSAGADRGGDARSPRQEQDGDIFRQRPGRARRHDDEMPEPGRLLWPGSRDGLGERSANAAPVTTTKSTPGMPQGAQNIRRIEARGGVTVITKDQNASGDLGIYDLQVQDNHLERQCRGQPGAERHSWRTRRR